MCCNNIETESQNPLVLTEPEELVEGNFYLLVDQGIHGARCKQSVMKLISLTNCAGVVVLEDASGYRMKAQRCDLFAFQ
jgi:hypothetical protein